MTSPSKLNNQAAFLIQNESYEEAISLLQKAMKKVRLAISGDLRPELYRATAQESLDGDDEINNNNNGNASSTNDNAEFCRFLSSAEPSSCFSKCTSSASTTSSSSSSSTIFSSPLLLNWGIDLLDEASCEHFSYVAVYNLALAHHLFATKAASSLQLPRRTCRILLQRALTLYENAHYVLTSSPDMEVSALHSLAIWSNLGHVHHALGQEENSELCYQNLLSTIFYIVDSERGFPSNHNDDDGNENHNHVDSIPIDGFFSNVFSLLLRSDTVAPAA